MKPTVGSLFAGIGGFDLGLERAGFEVRWQVEIDPFCRRVLEKHWPNVRRYEDVREVGAHNLERVDLICGGFPCQDISNEGKRIGIDGERSGLWREFSRLVGELRPDYVVVENVAALTVRGLGRVLGDLANFGFDAEWSCVSACALGAPHMRDRLWIVAYSESTRCNTGGIRGWFTEGWSEPHNGSTSSIRPWSSEPSVSGVAYGIPNRSHRIRTLGNAVVPQIAEWIGRRILEAQEVKVG